MRRLLKFLRRIGHHVQAAPLSLLVAPRMRSEGGERPPSEWRWRFLPFGRKDALPVAGFAV
jgi:hypothetical protein